jgi:methylase of polypeptide subunit release factors
VTETYDIIVFNPPYVPSTSEDQEEAASWAGGTDGRAVIDRFIAAAPDYLATDGVILILLSTRNDINAVADACREAGLAVEEVAREQLHFEELVVLAVEHAA